MVMRTAVLTLYLILPIMANEGTPTIFPLETVSCNANGKSLINCGLWQGRLKEEGHTGIKCHDAKDHMGEAMWGCSPKWIKLYSMSEKKIFATYKITDTGDGLHAHATIDYPEATWWEISLIIISAVFLILCCAASITEPAYSQQHATSFTDVAIATALFNSFTNSNPGAQWGGEDYSHKDD
jgi:hypothetical protein